MDRARKQCLLRGSDVQKKGGNLVAWETVMKPKEKGGLSVINLRLQNDALLLKQLVKFYNNANIPWVQLIWYRYYTNKVPHTAREVGSFWWKDVLRLHVIFRNIARCEIGDGATVCFWDDSWDMSVFSQEYPRLASFALNADASVKEIMQAENLDDIFFLPLSQQAYAEFVDLQNRLQNLPYDDTATDRWSPVWGNRYTSQRFYQHVFQEVDAHPIFKIMWKSRCTARIKFFAWLVLVDRLNTKTMLRRRHLNIQDTVTCVMCSTGAEETIEHLFFDCPFAKVCWATVHFQWDELLPLWDRFIHAGTIHNLPFFTEATLIAAWELWKLRNDKVFQRRDSTPSIWLGNFKNQCILQSVRFKDDLRSSFCVWLDSFS